MARPSGRLQDGQVKYVLSLILVKRPERHLNDGSAVRTWPAPVEDLGSVPSQQPSITPGPGDLTLLLTLAGIA